VVTQCLIGIIYYVNYLSLAALIHTYRDGPQVASDWLEATLEDHLGGYRPEEGPAVTRAWAVGGVLGTESLVQMRPVVRDLSTRFADDFLRAPCQCTMGGFVAASGSSRPPRFGISRFQRWIALSAGSGLGPAVELDEDRREALRQRVLGALPSFIRRSLRDGSDRELLGMSLIANLHAATSSGKTYADPQIIRRALRELDAVLGKPAAIAVMISDGQTIGILHRGGSARLVEPPAIERRRALADLANQENAPHAALLLLSPPEAPPPEIPKGRLSEIPNEVFTLRARHPVRIDQD